MRWSEELQNRCLQIEIPLKVAEGEEAEYSYFSGFLLADGLVITCRHGFVDTGERPYNTVQKIRLLSQGMKTEIAFVAEDMAGLVDEGHLLFESESYDIALLKCDLSIGLAGAVQRFLSGELDAAGEWQAGGYPFFYRESADTRGFRLFSGSFEAMEYRNKTLHLKIDSLSLSRMNDWESVSGSPVFIQGKLAGIIRELGHHRGALGQQVIHNDMLQASCIERLWNDRSGEGTRFQEVLLPLLSEAANYHLQNLLRWFDTDSGRQMAKALHKHPALKSDTNAALCSRLLALDKSELVDIFAGLGEGFKPQKLTETLLTALTGKYANADCFGEYLSPDKPYYDVPVVREEACELLMAAENQRNPQFRRINRGEGAEIVPGKYCLLAPPERGLEKSASEQVQNDLLNGMADLDTVVERIFGDFPPARARTYTPERKRQTIKAKLRREQANYYWPVEATAANQQALKDIYTELSEVTVLNILDDAEIDVEEEALFDKLRHFIKE